MVFENIENTKIMFFENCFCSINLVFSLSFMFFMFFQIKKIVFKNYKQTALSVPTKLPHSQ